MYRALIAVILVVSCFFGLTSLYAGTCTDAYTSGATPPTGYGAAYNLFSCARNQLAKKCTCGDTSITTTVGNGNSSIYIYKQGYAWNGARWGPFTITSESALPWDAWYTGSAKGTLTIPSGNQTRYYVGYTCMQTSGARKCGCHDHACAMSAWQLQQLHKVPTPTMSTSTTPAQRRDQNYKVLGKGVNLTDWKQSVLTSADFNLFSRANVTNVRLPVSTMEMTGDWHLLDNVVKNCLAHNISVQIDWHYWTGYLDQSTFVSNWQKTAHHFAQIDSDRIFFELLNEPDGVRWIDAGQEEAIAAIRQVAPYNTILVAGSGWARVTSQRVYADKNTMNVLHWYSPSEFTHQGAEWGSPRPCGVAYSESYAYDVLRSMQDAATWARKNNTRIVANEFGVYRHCSTLSQSDVNKWFEATRIAYESVGITAWSVWEYDSSGFSINNGSQWKTGVDRALGFTDP